MVACRPTTVHFRRCLGLRRRACDAVSPNAFTMSTIVPNHIPSALISSKGPLRSSLDLHQAHSSSVGKKPSWSRLMSTDRKYAIIVQDILNQPVGSLDKEHWKKAQKAIRDLGRINGDRAYDLCFDLLDRLIAEVEIGRKLHAQAKPSASSSIEEKTGATIKLNPSNLYTFLNTALYYWRNSFVGAKDQSSHMQPSEVLRKIRSWSSASGGLLQLDTNLYTMILEAAASNKTNPSEGVDIAESLLEWMADESFIHQNFTVQPNTTSVATVMKAWVDASGEAAEAPKRIESWVNRLQEWHEKGWPDVKPNLVVYNIWLHALAKAKLVDRAEQVLQTMLRDDIDDSSSELINGDSIFPDRISFSTLLLAYTNLGTLEAMTRAETLLSQMLQLYESGVESAKPNVVSFTTVMNGYAQLGEAKAAEALLIQMEKMYKESLDIDWEADILTFNTIMMAYSRARQPENATFWLDCADEKHSVQLNDRSFHAVLAGWAKVGDPDQAEDLLRRMHQLYADGEIETPPSVVTYNLVLDAWAKSRRKDAWRRGKEILAYMEKLHQSGNSGIKPDSKSWNTVINCFRFCGQGDLHHAFKLLEDFFVAFKEDRVDGGPTLHTWNSLLACCIGNTQDDYRVQQIWERMKEERVRPDIVSYNTLISCYTGYAKIKPSTHAKVDSILNQLDRDDNLKPTRATYLALVDHWISRGELQKAEEVLKAFCRDKSGNIEPDRAPFHKVLRAWSDLKKPQKVESIVLLMEELHDRHGFSNIKPTTDTYNILLRAWALSKGKQAGERVELILREMAVRNVSVNVKSYDNAVEAWANSGDLIALTKIEHLILEMILTGNPLIVPSEGTYMTWLKTIDKSEYADKGRRAQEVLKMMQIHKLEPSGLILEAVQNLSTGKSIGLTNSTNVGA